MATSIDLKTKSKSDTGLLVYEDHCNMTPWNPSLKMIPFSSAIGRFFDIATAVIFKISQRFVLKAWL